MKILIAGDSFAADWTIKYPDAKGWPNLLADKFAVVNLAQAGVTEYKILAQIRSVTDLKRFDLVVISHTSPYRVHTRRHPVHWGDALHGNSDLCVSDIDYHASGFKAWFNPALRSANRFFLDHFDPEYQETVYLLLKQQIHQLLHDQPCIVIENSISLPGSVGRAEIFDICHIQESNSGLYNHLDEHGNGLVFDGLCDLISQPRSTHWGS